MELTAVGIQFNRSFYIISSILYCCSQLGLGIFKNIKKKVKNQKSISEHLISKFYYEKFIVKTSNAPYLEPHFQSFGDHIDMWSAKKNSFPYNNTLFFNKKYNGFEKNIYDTNYPFYYFKKYFHI